MDQSKKTMRHFYCRDVLWETFEQIAADFDCSIDYLVNEAMRYYARSKNYQAPHSTAARPEALPQLSAKKMAAAPIPLAQPMQASVPPPLRPQPSLKSPILIFDNQRIRVDKDEFIIGRGSKNADLSIKDGNVSRRHACIVRQGNDWIMKDLGSTNGVELDGARIDQKRIEEGDVFYICEHELRFTFRDE